MFDWSEQKLSSNNAYYVLCVRDLDTMEIVNEIWGKFFLQIIKENSSIDWNYVRVEIWADSGRIIIYPANNKFEKRIELSGIEIKISLLKEFYANLVDRSDISDDEFNNIIDNYIINYAKLLHTGIAARNIEKEIDVRFYNSDSEYSLNI